MLLKAFIIRNGHINIAFANCIETMSGINDKLSGNNRNLLIIIDRGSVENQDTAFITKYDDIITDFNEVTNNYFIGMTFNIEYGSDVRCYFNYGNRETLGFMANK